MISPEKREANRNNARKSTGPKSAEGKARSARNAVTHGLTSKPGETTEAYRETLAEWVDDLKPRGIAERTLTERACRAAWNLLRCDRHEDATSAKRNRDAAESYDLAEAARVEAVGRRLIAVPIGDEDPATLVADLRRTAAGVSWLLARWAELGRALKEPTGWDEARRFVAVRLKGLRPESVGNHPAIGWLLPRPVELSTSGSWFDNPALNGALEAAVEAGEQGLGDPKKLWFDCVKAVAGRGQGHAESESADAKRLGTLVRTERLKLARLMRRVLKGRAAEDRAGAAERAMFDESKSLSLCIRYATAASRDLHRSISDLAKLRKASDGEGQDEGSEPPTSPPDPGPGTGEDSPTPDTEKLRNEPTDAPREPTSAGPQLGSQLVIERHRGVSARILGDGLTITLERFPLGCSDGVPRRAGLGLPLWDGRPRPALRDCCIQTGTALDARELCRRCDPSPAVSASPEQRIAVSEPDRKAPASRRRGHRARRGGRIANGPEKMVRRNLAACHGGWAPVRKTLPVMFCEQLRRPHPPTRRGIPSSGFGRTCVDKKPGCPTGFEPAITRSTISIRDTPICPGTPWGR